MQHVARQIKPAERRYSGGVTEPERWEKFQPREGDVIVVTPAKSGTTWTQSMIAMLLYGTSDLPDKLSVLSPWIDSNFVPIEQYLSHLEAQTGRRVIKTHTPVDGWPVWQGVDVVAVFRHPLEVFHSIRNHLEQTKIVDEHPLMGDTETALSLFLNAEAVEDDFQSASVAGIQRHFAEAVLTPRLPRKLVLHYSAMLRDHAGTVAALDAFLGTGRSPALQAEITAATAFSAMKRRAVDFAPEANIDAWHDEAAFFAGGRSGASSEGMTETQIAAYHTRLAELLPDPAHRRWIETGEGDV